MDKEVELLIEGDVVSLIRRQVLKTVTLDAFTSNMSYAGWSTGVLPVGCRMAGKSKDGRSFFFVMERPPMMTRVSILRSGDYTVHTGFVQFWLMFPSNGHLPGLKFVTTTKRPIRSLDDTVYVFPWPNVYRSTGAICTGSQTYSGETREEVCEDFSRTFFGANFNFDLTVEFPSYLGGGMDITRSFKKWAEISVSNPMVGICPDMDYRALSTVSEFVQKVSTETRNV